MALFVSESELAVPKVYFTPTPRVALSDLVLSCLVRRAGRKEGRQTGQGRHDTTRARRCSGSGSLHFNAPHVPSMLGRRTVAPCTLELIAVTALSSPAHRVTWAPPSKHNGTVLYCRERYGKRFSFRVPLLPVAASRRRLAISD